MVLPELSPDAATHYSHYVKLIQELATRTRVVLIVERAGEGDEPRLAELLPGVGVWVQRETSPVLRALELVRLLIALRRRGFRHAYGSYSPFYGVAGGSAGRLVGMTISYWHCRSDFFDRHISRRMTLRRVLTDTLPFILSLHLSKRVITGTPGLAGLYRRTFLLPREKVRVVPNEIDASAFRSGPAGEAVEERPIVLFIGRLSEHKGARLLPAIARQLHEAAPQARFVIAGGGPEESMVREQLGDLLRRGSVAMLGYVPNPEIPALLRDASVLVMPSLEEGFPRRILEAMAAGLPFVATDVGGVGEVIPAIAGAQLVPPGDAAAIARRAAALLEQPGLLAELADAGIRHVERYAVERVAPIFLREVCGDGGG